MNLQNQITIWLHFTHLEDDIEAKSIVFRKNSENIRTWSLERVFSTPESAEELYSPYTMFTIDDRQERRLRKYYATERGISVNAIGVRHI